MLEKILSRKPGTLQMRTEARLLSEPKTGICFKQIWATKEREGGAVTLTGVLIWKDVQSERKDDQPLMRS